MNTFDTIAFYGLADFIFPIFLLFVLSILYSTKLVKQFSGFYVIVILVLLTGIYWYFENKIKNHI
jgi:hypothetical protein